MCTSFYARGVCLRHLAMHAGQLDLDIVQVGLDQNPDFVVVAPSYADGIPAYLLARTIVVDDHTENEGGAFANNNGCIRCNPTGLARAIKRAMNPQMMISAF